MSSERYCSSRQILYVRRDMEQWGAARQTPEQKIPERVNDSRTLGVNVSHIAHVCKGRWTHSYSHTKAEWWSQPFYIGDCSQFSSSLPDNLLAPVHHCPCDHWISADPWGWMRKRPFFTCPQSATESYSFSLVQRANKYETASCNLCTDQKFKDLYTVVEIQ